MKHNRFNKAVISGILGFALFMGVMPQKAQAASKSTIQLGNVIGNALTTVVRGIVSGKVKSVGDALKMAAYGGAAGYGFYQAKNLVSNGNITAGVALANLSASISENVSYGHHPLAYIGYTLGFSRIRVATPLAKNPRAIINLEISAHDIVNTFMALKYADSFSFKGGLLTFSASEAYKNNALGWTFGPYATTMQGASDIVLGHEAVHVIQNLQLAAASPYEPFLKKGGSRNAKLFAFSGLKIDSLALVNNLAMNAQDYESQWKEIEAYSFSGR